MPNELTPAVLEEMKGQKMVCLIYHQHDSDCLYQDYLMHYADALISAAEERDRQALDILRLQGLAEHLELENARLQEKLQEARDLNKGQQDARILEDENRVLDEKTAALQAEVDRLNIMLAVLSEAEEDTKRIDWIARSYGDTPHDAHRRLREDIDVMRRKEQQEMTYE